ncbi:NAD-glutamate dehydrogenase [Celerinatantimonas yamalensis]|uniref:NAD-glutamate dehydrogenase n=1 Tax=Celerinatantimonas yamalensis TaxID=559956 RepID=A0ABW9G329_9GAMM
MTRVHVSSVLLEKVYAIVERKLPDGEASIATQFMAKMFEGLSSIDLSRHSDSDLYGMGINLWNALQETTVDETYIYVYNPELSRHGWQSAHTVVEIVVRDQPFLVDSIRMALNRSGINAHLFLHEPMAVQRDSKGLVSTIARTAENRDSAHQTAFIIEIDRQSSQQTIDTIKDELSQVLKEISLVVCDWMSMRDKLQTVTRSLEQSAQQHQYDFDQQLGFLKWLSNDNFTFLGYRFYALKPVEGDYHLEPAEGDVFGIFRSDIETPTVILSSVPEEARYLALNKNPLLLNKSRFKSRVHRPAYIDHIGVKAFDVKGKVVGEHRFIGLYASVIYNHSVMDIPLINEKVKRIMDNSDLSAGSHAYKALLNFIETYPRDDLIQASEDELLETGIAVFQIQERDQVKLFVRRDIYGRFYSCLVYTTKERFNTSFRQKTQAILKEYFSGVGDVEFSTYFTEGALARTHYLVRVEAPRDDINLAELEQNLIEAARSWDDKLSDSLIANFGEDEAHRLIRKYQAAFPRSFKESVMPGSAVADISQLEQLHSEEELGMLLYRPQEQKRSSNQVNLKLFHLGAPLFLSDILPMLENMGLRVIGESPYRIHTVEEQTYWILEFAMCYVGDGELELDKYRDNFQQAFAGIWRGTIESDGFNRLVLQAGLTGRNVTILRSYAKYMRQIGVKFSQQYMEEALSRYPHIAAMLVQLFQSRFALDLRDSAQEELLSQSIIDSLERVDNLDDDRIIRRFLELIQATIRTNYYRYNQMRDYISFKFLPEHISEMPEPKPHFEIFVYSPRVEGVHLRGGKVARGGLRWSDRREDFRTEILGLMKAQQVKNTVIVPVGAKGGFVCKQLPAITDRDAWLSEGQNCYRIFIRGLLDITDNILDGEIISPEDVIRHDEDDPYLVVAADKGTATFSDIANEISAQYQFWLGDAFASGGSHGYDHKGMGITAKGAWESVQRHFKELGKNCQLEPFSCIGIGDMAGDVFGNGMLLSEQTQLIAAFNHMHIFIDPTPDTAASYQERKRLFDKPRSSWDDYDRSLISKGGGLFLRSAKSIPLSVEMRQILATDAKRLAPNELIKVILKAPVDLLWNGGIGTYVKATHETDLEVGDRANDPVRINGAELGAKIVGEGGNLGCTQQGRIEFATHGGQINTDFTDNVGGVDCSDNEVNIKILLNSLVRKGDLTEKQRNEILTQMTDDISTIVLRHAYRQGQSISITESLGQGVGKENIRFIHSLERQGWLDRTLENLPSDDELSERIATKIGLTRPEMAILVAYAKMVLKQQFNTPELTEDEYFQQVLVQSFPPLLQERYRDAMDEHPLRSEIIATRLANQIVDDMGFNFVARLQDDTGASAAEICICYVMSREIFGIQHLFEQLEALDNQVDAQVQLDLMGKVRRLMRRAVRRFLRQRNRKLTIDEQVARYQPVYQTLINSLDDALVPEEVTEIQDNVDLWALAGVPVEVARRVAELSSIFACLDIAEISEQVDSTAFYVADLYFSLGAKMGLHWFLNQILTQPVDNHWQALARASFREELDWQQRVLVTHSIRWLEQEKLDADPGVDEWMLAHSQLIERWQHMLADFKTSTTHEFAKFSVLLRELNLLNLNCADLG